MCFDKRVVEFLSFCEPLEACPVNIVFNTAVLTQKNQIVRCIVKCQFCSNFAHFWNTCKFTVGLWKRCQFTEIGNCLK
jgi:hypothetical protein